MAGIAFRLQKLAAGESYSELVRAYFYSALIAAGPFIVVMFWLAAIKMLIEYKLSAGSTDLVLGIIVYIYAFSMIGVSPFFYTVTRYLADKYYLKQIDTFTPSYLSVLYAVFIIQTVVAIPYLIYLDVAIGMKWLILMGYYFVSGIWIAMIYVSAARNYIWIVVAFILGAIAGILMSISMGAAYGVAGVMSGFVIGQGVCFLLLTVRIFGEFGYSSAYDFGFFSYYKSHPYLALIGVFYYLGIWVDKFVFWFSSKGEVVVPGIQLYRQYDTPMFLAYLSIIPSMAFFLVQMETSFVKYYHAYYESIRERETYQVIQEKRVAMIDILSNHFQKYALYQGFFSFIIIIFLFEIAAAFYLNPLQMGVFRIGILAAFLQMGMMMIINIIFYFDFQKDNFYITLIFVATNLLFTLVSYYIGFSAFGFGYAASCFVCVLVAFLMLNNKLKHINYWTFMTQPILIPGYKFESEQRDKK